MNMTKQGRDEPWIFFGMVKEGVPNTRSPWFKALSLYLPICLSIYLSASLSLSLEEERAMLETI
jgi:hypothetical protein